MILFNKKMISQILLFISFATVQSKVTELTPSNWDELVVKSGKNSFVKFFAPWCGHCKKMKPDWDKLGEQYGSESNILIGDVDCTGSGKELCETHGVEGFPTLKSFWRTSSEDYSGSRDYVALKTFSDNMKPMCAPDFMENCSDEQKVKIETLQKLGSSELKQKLDEMKDKISTAEKTHNDLLKTLQDQFSKSNENLEKLKTELRPEINLVEQILAPNEEKQEKKDEL